VGVAHQKGFGGAGFPQQSFYGRDLLLEAYPERALAKGKMIVPLHPYTVAEINSGVFSSAIRERKRVFPEGCPPVREIVSAYTIRLVVSAKEGMIFLSGS
jgi:hypothetical protein